MGEGAMNSNIGSINQYLRIVLNMLMIPLSVAIVVNI